MQLKPMDPNTIKEILSKREQTHSVEAPSIDLLPIPHPSVLLTGRNEKRAVTGNEAFDPESVHEFFWGAYGKSFPHISAWTVI